MSRIITLSKSELARLCNVSTQTIGTWCNKRYFEDLKKLGYNKNQRILLPEQLKFLIGTLDIDTKDLKE
jgi:hypothetical protein